MTEALSTTEIAGNAFIIPILPRQSSLELLFSCLATEFLASRLAFCSCSMSTLFSQVIYFSVKSAKDFRVTIDAKDKQGGDLPTVPDFPLALPFALPFEDMLSLVDWRETMAAFRSST